MAWQENDLFEVGKEEHEHVVEDLRSDHFGLPLGHVGHNAPIHDEAGPVPLVSTVQVKAARLQKPNCVVRQPWLRLDCTQPLDVLVKLFTSLGDVIEAGLNPLEPVSLCKARRHRIYSLLPNEIFKCSDPSALVISQVVPPIVDATIILSGLVVGNGVFPVRNDKVGLERGQIVRILLVVSWVIWVTRIRLVNLSLQLLQILFVGPLFVEVAIAGGGLGRHGVELVSLLTSAICLNEQ